MYNLFQAAWGGGLLMSRKHKWKLSGVERYTRFSCSQSGKCKVWKLNVKSTQFSRTVGIQVSPFCAELVCLAVCGHTHVNIVCNEKRNRSLYQMTQVERFSNTEIPTWGPWFTKQSGITPRGSVDQPPKSFNLLALHSLLGRRPIAFGFHEG